MALQTREHLKSKFEKGDLPTQEDFTDLIDSCVHGITGLTDTIQFADGTGTTNTVTIYNGIITGWVQ